MPTTDAETASPNEHLFLTITVDQGQSPLRIDTFLAQRIENASRAFIQRAITRGHVHVQGTPVRASYRVKPLDTIHIYREGPNHDTTIRPEPIPLDIIHEDDHILIVNKPPGMVVHPGHGHFTGTLVNALLFHLQRLPLFRQGGIRPGLAHRIDKDTSGLVAIGKTDAAMSRLSAQFADKTAARAYTALVWGPMPQTSGTIRSYLARDPADRQRMRAFQDPSAGKLAITHWRVIEHLPYTTLLECNLQTGRMHQIRAHMQSIQRPIFADERYGGKDVLRGVRTAEYHAFIQTAFRICPRQALHAHRLELIHPITRAPLTFHAPIPDDLAALLQHLRQWPA